MSAMDLEALAIQQALARELRAAGQDDPYVQEELALLLGPDASVRASEEGPGAGPATS